MLKLLNLLNLNHQSSLLKDSFLYLFAFTKNILLSNLHQWAQQTFPNWQLQLFPKMIVRFLVLPYKLSSHLHLGEFFNMSIFILLSIFLQFFMKIQVLIRFFLSILLMLSWVALLFFQVLPYKLSFHLRLGILFLEFCVLLLL